MFPVTNDSLYSLCTWYPCDHWKDTFLAETLQGCRGSLILVFCHVNRVFWSLSASMRLARVAWRKICLLGALSDCHLECSIFVQTLVYWNSLREATFLCTLVRHFIEETTSVTFHFDQDHFLRPTSKPFNHKKNHVKMYPTSPGSGQKSLCPHLDRIMSNAKQSIKIMSWTCPL